MQVEKLECKGHGSELKNNSDSIVDELDEMNAANDALYYTSVKMSITKLIDKLQEHPAVVVLYDAHCGQFYPNCIESKQETFIFEHDCPANGDQTVCSNLITEECPFGLCDDRLSCQMGLSIAVSKDVINYTRDESESDLISPCIEKILIWQYLQDHFRIRIPQLNRNEFVHWSDGKPMVLNRQYTKYSASVIKLLTQLHNVFEECHTNMLDKPKSTTNIDDRLKKWYKQANADRVHNKNEWLQMPDYFNAIQSLMEIDIGMIQRSADLKSKMIAHKYIDMLLQSAEWEFIAYVCELTINNPLRKTMLPIIDANNYNLSQDALNCILKMLDSTRDPLEYMMLKLGACVVLYREKGREQCGFMLHSLRLQIESKLNTRTDLGPNAAWAKTLWNVYMKNLRCRKMLMMVVKASAPVVDSYCAN